MQKPSKFLVSIKLSSGETSVEIFALDADSARSAVASHYKENGERCEVLSVGPA